MKKYNSFFYKNGYNIEKCEFNGGNPFINKEIRKKISEKTKNMWLNNKEEMIKRFKQANKNNKISKKTLQESSKKNSKKVIDNKGCIYNSLAEASTFNNVAECTIRSCIKNGYTLRNNKKRFAYYNEGNFLFILNYRNKIKCLTNNKTYSSVVDASNDLNLKNPQSINRVCRGERYSYKGYRFIYVTKG